jgi:hypothetical protein
LLAGALWAFTVVGASVGVQDVTFLAILDAVAWVTVPFYARRVRMGYLVGIVAPIFGLVGLIALPGTPPWYVFSSPIFDLSYVMLYMVGLALLYFSYKSYKELK